MQLNIREFRGQFTPHHGLFSISCPSPDARVELVPPGYRRHQAERAPRPSPGRRHPAPELHDPLRGRVRGGAQDPDAPCRVLDDGEERRAAGSTSSPCLRHVWPSLSAVSWGREWRRRLPWDRYGPPSTLWAAGPGLADTGRRRLCFQPPRSRPHACSVWLHPPVSNGVAAELHPGPDTGYVHEAA